MVDQRGEIPLLPFGYPIGNVPAASRRISLIIRFHFVSFVLFVVIFLSRYYLLTPSRKICVRNNGNKVAEYFSPNSFTEDLQCLDMFIPSDRGFVT